MEKIEVESRYIVKNSKLLHGFIESKLKLFSLEDNKKECDIYYDSPDGKLFKQGIFIRLRDNSTIDFKFNKDDFLSDRPEGEHTSCSELSFLYPLKTSEFSKFCEILKFLKLEVLNECNFEAFMEKNKIEKSITILKNRKKFKKDQMVVCIDEIEGLGTFIEIEALVDNDLEIHKTKEIIDSFLTPDLDFVRLTTGYVALSWKEKNFEVYKAGKYHTAEDRALFNTL